MKHALEWNRVKPWGKFGPRLLAKGADGCWIVGKNDEQFYYLKGPHKLFFTCLTMSGCQDVAESHERTQPKTH